MRPYLASVLSSILLTLILYNVAAHFWGESDLLGKVQSVEIGVWLPILALSMMNYLLRFYRWTRYISLNSTCLLPGYQHLLVYFAGFALTTTPGKAGEALRSVYLAQAGVSVSQSLSALFSERLIDLIAIVLLSLLIVESYYDDKQAWIFIAVLGVAGSIFALIHSPYLRLLLNYFGKISGRFLQRAFQYLVEMLDASKQMLVSKELAIGGSIGIVAWLAEGFGLFLILHYLGFEVGVAAAIGVYAASMLVGALSFIPGGLGSTELAMGALLIALGADQSTAITATLVCRIATLWFAVALGMLSALCLTALGVTPKLGTTNE